VCAPIKGVPTGAPRGRDPADRLQHPLRAKVIDRLHELEEQAKGAAFRVPQSLPEALRLAAELAEKNEQLALENKEMAPKAVVFDNCVALRQESLATFVRTLEVDYHTVLEP